MSRPLRSVLIAVALTVFVCRWLPANADPTITFIVEADSIATAHGDGALTQYILDNSVLLGAAVGQLLDIAIEVGDAGDQAAEDENVALALRISRLYMEAGRSEAPFQLVTLYKNWTTKQRATRVAARDLESLAVEARDGGDFGTADARFIEAKGLYDQLGDKRSVAVTWGSMGVNAWYAGDFESVNSYYSEALTARRTIDDQILVGRTLNGLGSASRAIGDLAGAAEWYAQAVELRRQTGDVDGFTKSVTYLAAVYLEQGRMIDARDTMAEAVPYLAQSGDPVETVNAITMIGNVYSGMGDYARANEQFTKAAEFAGEIGDPLREGIALNNRASNYLLHFKFREAFADLDAAEPKLAEAGDDTELAKVHRNRGLAYRLTGQLEEARDELLAFRQMAIDIEDARLQLEAMINLALLYQELGAYDRGLAMADEAAEIAAASGDGVLWTDATINAATLLFLMRRYDESLERWVGVVEQAEHDGATHKLIEAKIGTAHVYSTTGQLDKARAFYQEAMTDAAEIGSLDYQVPIDIGLAHTYEKSDPNRAATYYEKALAGHEGVRQGVGASGRDSYLSGERRWLYEEVARYYASLDEDKRDSAWAARAFGVIERAKSRGLVEQLQHSVAGETSPAEAAAIDAMYAVTADDPMRADLEKTYLQLRDARVSNATQRLSANVATIEDVQKALPKHTIMLQYAMGDTVSLLWAIDRDHSELFELPNRAALTPDIQRMRDAITRPGAGDAALRDAARKLYVALLAPAEKRFKKARTIVIVPDGQLFEVPFEALLTTEPRAESAWSDEPFFARQHATLYAPSASVFVALQSKKTREYTRELIAIGDPDFSSLVPRAGEGALAPLPYTRSEVENISRNLDENSRRVLLGAAASESALKRELRTATPRLLHLATHGLVDAAEPSASSIALGADDVDDGYFYTLEILSEPIEVELVVMSACESARGRISRSEGVVGLSRAFIASGAGGVVASLWAVSDESTALLMAEFYSGMIDDEKSAVRALHEARLALLDDPDYAHPFYWSPFVVIGGPFTMVGHTVEGDRHTYN